MGLIGGSVQNSGLFQEQFAEDKLFLMVCQNHRFAKKTGRLHPHIWLRKRFKPRSGVGYLAVF